MTFETIYKTYYRKIFRLCMGYVNDHEWARDITQEAFITVWEKLDQFRNEASIGTWIFRIASNQCLRQIEKQKRMPRSEIPFEIEDQATANAETEGKIRLLYQCISELPETDRIIISLELEDVKQAEIAGIVGLSETNIRVRVHRIKEKLSQKFSQYERSDRF